MNTTLIRRKRKYLHGWSAQCRGMWRNNALFEKGVFYPATSSESLDIGQSFDIVSDFYQKTVSQGGAPSSIKGNKAFSVIIATEGNEFCTIARI